MSYLKGYPHFKGSYLFLVIFVGSVLIKEVFSGCSMHVHTRTSHSIRLIVGSVDGALVKELSISGRVSYKLPSGWDC